MPDDKKQEFDDLQNEIAGVETGRQPRIFDRDDPDIDPRTGKKKDDGFTQAVLSASAQAAKERLERLREMADRDAMGRLVFRTEDQTRAYYEDGTALTPDEMSVIEWKEGAPTWEEYQSAVAEWEGTGGPSLDTMEILNPVMPDAPMPGGKSLKLKF
jgi:hypothetical protein